MRGARAEGRDTDGSWSSLPASVGHCGGSSRTRNLHPLDLKIGYLCPLAKLHQDESGPEYVKRIYMNLRFCILPPFTDEDRAYI